MYWMKRTPWVTVVLSIATLFFHFGVKSPQVLMYERSAFLNMDLWRLISCHFVHITHNHLFWSGLTFLVLGVLCEAMNRMAYLATLTVSAVLIPTAIFFLLPDLTHYAGLSGIDCALYALAAIHWIQRELAIGNYKWAFASICIFLLLGAKILFEMTTGSAIFIDTHHTALVPVPLSHLVGGIAGVMVCIGWIMARPRKAIKLSSGPRKIDRHT